MGHGSGDVFIGFTNGNYMPEEKGGELLSIRCFPENQMDAIFRLAAETVEESILNSMIEAKAAIGLHGEVYHSLQEFIKDSQYNGE